MLSFWEPSTQLQLIGSISWSSAGPPCFSSLLSRFSSTSSRRWCSSRRGPPERWLNPSSSFSTFAPWLASPPSRSIVRLLLRDLDDGQIFYSNQSFLKQVCSLFGIVYLIFAVCITNFGTKLTFLLHSLQQGCELQERGLIKRLTARVFLYSHYSGARNNDFNVHPVLRKGSLLPPFLP